MSRNCLFCGKEANQTNSHIFSHSLIKSSLNVDGSNKRDKEFAFKISEKDFVRPYIGNAVLPDKVSEILGRELPVEEYQLDRDDFARDNIFCTICDQKLFGKLESYFFNNTYNKISNTYLEENISNIELSELDSKLFRLITYLQVWRAGIIGYNGLKIEEKYLRAIKEVLYNILSENEEEMIANLKKTEVNQFPIKLYFLQTSDTDKSSNIVMVNSKIKSPVFIIMNQIVIQLYFKEKQLKWLQPPLFGLIDLLKNKDGLNYYEKKMNLIVLNNKTRKEVLQKVAEFKANDFMSRIKLFITGTHKILYNKSMPDILFERFKFELQLLSRTKKVWTDWDTINQAIINSFKWYDSRIK